MAETIWFGLSVALENSFEGLMLHKIKKKAEFWWDCTNNKEIFIEKRKVTCRYSGAGNSYSYCIASIYKDTTFTFEVSFFRGNKIMAVMLFFFFFGHQYI